jgi:hypothetical protein
MAQHPKGKLELLVSELMALDLALQEGDHSAGEWYKLMTRHRSLRAQVMAMEEPVYPGDE